MRILDIGLVYLLNSLTLAVLQAGILYRYMSCYFSLSFIWFFFSFMILFINLLVI